MLGFSARSSAHRKLLEGIMTAGNNYIDKEDFLSLYLPAREKVFNATNICSGFAGTGLKPIDADRVLARLLFNFVRQHHY